MPSPGPHRRARLAWLVVALVSGWTLVLLAPTGSAAVDQVRSLARAAAASGGPLQTPVRGVVTSGYGVRVFPTFGESIHPGIDIAALGGTPVTAAADGVVVVAGFDAAAGNVVVVRHHPPVHARELRTLYGHLADIDVSPGEPVRAGDRIGSVGATGSHAMGPHLHFEVLLDGRPVDPADWL